MNAERTGFEPVKSLSTLTGLAIRRFRPLSHLSEGSHSSDQVYVFARLGFGVVVQNWDAHLCTEFYSLRSKTHADMMINLNFSESGIQDTCLGELFTYISQRFYSPKTPSTLIFQLRL